MDTHRACLVHMTASHMPRAHGCLPMDKMTLSDTCSVCGGVDKEMGGGGMCE